MGANARKIPMLSWDPKARTWKERRCSCWSRNLNFRAPNVNPLMIDISYVFFLMATAFMGYVLPFGQMSFWGATVITNLLSPFPSLIEWVSGGHYVYNPTLKRFFLFHFQFPFLLCGFRILHLFYLHFLSSNNPLRNSTNNKIPFFPFILWCYL